MNEPGDGPGVRMSASVGPTRPTAPEHDCNSNTAPAKGTADGGFRPRSQLSNASSHDGIDFIQDSPDYQWCADFHCQTQLMNHSRQRASIFAPMMDVDDVHSSVHRNYHSHMPHDFTYDDLARNIDANLAEIDMEDFRTEDIHSILALPAMYCGTDLQPDKQGEQVCSTEMSVCKSEPLFSPIKDNSQLVPAFSQDSLDCSSFDEQELMLTCRANKNNYTIAFEGSFAKYSDDSDYHEEAGIGDSSDLMTDSSCEGAVGRSRAASAGPAHGSNCTTPRRSRYRYNLRNPESVDNSLVQSDFVYTTWSKLKRSSDGTSSGSSGRSNRYDTSDNNNCRYWCGGATEYRSDSDHVTKNGENQNNENYDNNNVESNQTDSRNRHCKSQSMPNLLPKTRHISEMRISRFNLSTDEFDDERHDRNPSSLSEDIRVPLYDVRTSQSNQSRSSETGSQHSLSLVRLFMQSRGAGSCSGGSSITHSLSSGTLPDITNRTSSCSGVSPSFPDVDSSGSGIHESSTRPTYKSTLDDGERNLSDGKPPVPARVMHSRGAGYEGALYKVISPTECPIAEAEEESDSSLSEQTRLDKNEKDVSPGKSVAIGGVQVKPTPPPRVPTINNFLMNTLSKVSRSPSRGNVTTEYDGTGMQQSQSTQTRPGMIRGESEHAISRRVDPTSDSEHYSTSRNVTGTTSGPSPTSSGYVSSRGSMDYLKQVNGQTKGSAKHETVKILDGQSAMCGSHQMQTMRNFWRQVNVTIATMHNFATQIPVPVADASIQTNQCEDNLCDPALCQKDNTDSNSRETGNSKTLDAGSFGLNIDAKDDSMVGCEKTYSSPKLPCRRQVFIHKQTPKDGASNLKQPADSEKAIYVCYPNYTLPDLTFLREASLGSEVKELFLVPSNTCSQTFCSGRCVGARRNCSGESRSYSRRKILNTDFSHVRDWDSLNVLLPLEVRQMLAKVKKQGGERRSRDETGKSEEHDTSQFTTAYSEAGASDTSANVSEIDSTVTATLRGIEASSIVSEDDSEATVPPTPPPRSESLPLDSNAASEIPSRGIFLHPMQRAGKKGSEMYVYRYDSSESENSGAIQKLHGSPVKCRPVSLAEPLHMCSRGMSPVRANSVNEEQLRHGSTCQQRFSSPDVAALRTNCSKPGPTCSHRITETCDCFSQKVTVGLRKVGNHWTGNETDEADKASANSQKLQACCCGRLDSHRSHLCQQPTGTVTLVRVREQYEPTLARSTHSAASKERTSMGPKEKEDLRKGEDEKEVSDCETGKRCVNFESCHSSSQDLNAAHPPQEFHITPERYCCSRQQHRYIDKKALVSAVNKAVEELVDHFGHAQDPQGRFILGSSVLTPACGQIVLGHLCPVLYAILSDGLQPELYSLFGRVENSVWRVIEGSSQLGPSTQALTDLIIRINSEDGLPEKTMKFNAFIFGLLNIRSLDSWFAFLRTHDSILHRHYFPHAFLVLSALSACTNAVFCCREMNTGDSNLWQQLYDEFLIALQPLAMLPFDLDLMFEKTLLQSNRQLPVKSPSLNIANTPATMLFNFNLANIKGRHLMKSLPNLLSKLSKEKREYGLDERDEDNEYADEKGAREADQECRHGKKSLENLYDDSDDESERRSRLRHSLRPAKSAPFCSPVKNRHSCTAPFDNYDLYNYYYTAANNRHHYAAPVPFPPPPLSTKPGGWNPSGGKLYRGHSQDSAVDLGSTINTDVSTGYSGLKSGSYVDLPSYVRGNKERGGHEMELDSAPIDPANSSGFSLTGVASNIRRRWSGVHIGSKLFQALDKVLQDQPWSGSGSDDGSGSNSGFQGDDPRNLSNEVYCDNKGDSHASALKNKWNKDVRDAKQLAATRKNNLQNYSTNEKDDEGIKFTLLRKKWELLSAADKCNETKPFPNAGEKCPSPTKPVTKSPSANNVGVTARIETKGSSSDGDAAVVASPAVSSSGSSCGNNSVATAKSKIPRLVTSPSASKLPKIDDLTPNSAEGAPPQTVIHNTHNASKGAVKTRNQNFAEKGGAISKRHSAELKKVTSPPDTSHTNFLNQANVEKSPAKKRPTTGLILKRGSSNPNRKKADS